MTAIHRPATLTLWWYAVFAVLAGVVLALAVVVLQGSHEVAATTSQILPGPPIVRPSQMCFATPHYPNPELVRSACTR